MYRVLRPRDELLKGQLEGAAGRAKGSRQLQTLPGRKTDLSPVSETSEDGGGLSASVNYQMELRTSGNGEGSSRGRSTATRLSRSRLVLHGHAHIMLLFPKFYPEKPS